MELKDWILELNGDEQAYVRQCFRFWAGDNKNYEPEIPSGMSKSRADILRYHTKSLAESHQRRRKVEDLDTISFKASHDFHQQIAFYAAQIDVNLSIFIRTCIELSKETLVKHPELVYSLKSVLPK